MGVNPSPKVKGSPAVYDLTLRKKWARERRSGRWTVYWGPIKYDNLTAFNVGLGRDDELGLEHNPAILAGDPVGLEGTVRGDPQLWLRDRHLHDPRRATLWPLTRKSQISMKKMAALQPEMRIREEHNKNPQAMNAEIMGSTRNGE